MEAGTCAEQAPAFRLGRELRKLRRQSSKGVIHHGGHREHRVRNRERKLPIDLFGSSLLKLPYGALLISCVRDGSCDASQPPPSAWIKPLLAVIC